MSPIYWIEGPWPGRPAIVPRPRGGDWLEDEIASWRNEGVAVVISALTSEEIVDLELSKEGELVQLKGMEFLAFPIPDRGVPSSFDKMAEFSRILEGELAHGKNVAVHCRQGIGRSSMLIACTLVLGGIEPVEAFARIQSARGFSVPDTPEQRDWVIKFAKKLTSVAKT
jgi:protein-tyrosine phosphatase